MHRTDGDDQKRQQRHQCGEAAKEHRPTYLLDGLDNGLAAFAVDSHPATEIRENMDVVGDGNGKRQDGGNHQHRRIDIHLCEPRDTIGHKQAANH